MGAHPCDGNRPRWMGKREIPSERLTHRSNTKVLKGLEPPTRGSLDYMHQISRLLALVIAVIAPKLGDEIRKHPIITAVNLKRAECSC